MIGRLRVQVAELLQRLDQRFFRHRRLHGAAGRVAGARAAPVEARAVAVGVALVLAQVHVQARGELAAEGHVHHDQRHVVRVGALDAELAGRDHGLGGARLVDEVDRRALAARVGRRRRRRAVPERVRQPRTPSSSCCRAVSASMSPTMRKVGLPSRNSALRAGRATLVAAEASRPTPRGR